MPEHTSDSNSTPHLLARFRAGQMIFRTGEAGAEMFVIEDGQVEIFRQHGPTETRLVVLEAGDFFGEMSILEDLPRSASARALTDCRVLPVDASIFDQILRDHPELAIRIMRTLSGRLRVFDEAESRALSIAAGPLVSALRKAVPLAVQVDAASVTALVDVPLRPAARLVHPPSGKIWSLTGERDQILGRRDPVTGLEPEIDLTDLDVERSLSRRHARIVFHDGQFFLREEIGTNNGTFVGQQRLATGKEQELKRGDRVRVGRLDFVFELAPAKR
ncbi:MAG: cyclic nucleotide-binding domain-containing protein [Acidobacteriota bacterium]